MRRAFLLGQQGYPAGCGLGKLEFPRKDVKELERVLREKCRFEVTRMLDYKRSDFETLRSRIFPQNLPERQEDETSVFLFYYAGHGFDVSGQTFLVPIDANHDDPKTWYSLNFLMQPSHDLSSRRQGLTQKLIAKDCSASPVPGTLILIVLDCCRDRPEEELLAAAAVGEMPWTPIPSDTPICYLYACDQGRIACEEDGGGIFTKAFIRAIEACRGQNFEQLWEQWHKICLQTSCQRPWRLCSAPDKLSKLVINPSSSKWPGKLEDPSAGPHRGCADLEEDLQLLDVAACAAQGQTQQIAKDPPGLPAALGPVQLSLEGELGQAPGHGQLLEVVGGYSCQANLQGRVEAGMVDGSNEAPGQLKEQGELVAGMVDDSGQSPGQPSAGATHVIDRLPSRWLGRLERPSDVAPFAAQGQTQPIAGDPPAQLLGLLAALDPAQLTLEEELRQALGHIQVQEVVGGNPREANVHGDVEAGMVDDSEQVPGQTQVVATDPCTWVPGLLGVLVLVFGPDLVMRIFLSKLPQQVCHFMGLSLVSFVSAVAVIWSPLEFRLMTSFHGYVLCNAIISFMKSVVETRVFSFLDFWLLGTYVLEFGIALCLILRSAIAMSEFANALVFVWLVRFPCLCFYVKYWTQRIGVGS